MLAFWRAVIAALSRNPVYAWHWIPDVVTPDLIRGRDDNCRSGMTNTGPS
jgi:hypothetical protein